MQEPAESKYIPALGFHCLTPCYDAIVRTTGRERTVKQALIGQAQLEPDQRGLFLTVQLLDGFKNTQDHVQGKLISLFEQNGFVDVSQRQSFNTIHYAGMVFYKICIFTFFIVPYLALRIIF